MGQNPPHLRLKGTTTRTYKQPVRLGDTGVWETHGSLSGHLVDSGLAGGGAYISTFYDRGLATCGAPSACNRGS